MRLETYEFDQRPAREWAPPSLRGRSLAVETYGGSVVHSSPGDWPDNIFSLPFASLVLDPDETLLYTNASEAPGHAMSTGGALACPLPVGAGALAAPCACTLKLQRQVAATGLLSVEVWDSAGAGPQRKVGQLGVIDVASIPTASFGSIEAWGYVSWPLLPTHGGYLVLNARQLAGGTVTWGKAGAGSYYAYTPAGGWVVQVGDLGATIWQGSMYHVLLGFQSAYCFAGGYGPQQWRFRLDDSHTYAVIVAGVRSSIYKAVLARTAEGEATNVVLDLMLVSEIGQQDLEPAP